MCAAVVASNTAVTSKANEADRVLEAGESTSHLQVEGTPGSNDLREHVNVRGASPRQCTGLFSRCHDARHHPREPQHNTEHKTKGGKGASRCHRAHHCHTAWSPVPTSAHAVVRRAGRKRRRGASPISVTHWALREARATADSEQCRAKVVVAFRPG